MPAPKDPQKREEWKKKLSKAGKGRDPWNKGVKVSEIEEFDSYREKLSEAQKKRERQPLSDESKEKISKALKGRKKSKPVSKETREKLSKARTGKKHSKETRKKMSEIAKKRGEPSPEARAKMSRSQKAREREPLSEETKKKISETLIKKYEDPNYKGTFTGRKHSEETLEKMRGPKPNAQGISKSEEHKQKISQALKGRPRNPNAGRKKGVPCSEESKKKISEGLKKVQCKSRFKKGHTPWSAGKKMTRSYREKMSKSISLAYTNGSIAMGYISGHHNSPKAGKVSYRSSYELKAYQILDNDLTVETYFVETLGIDYHFEGKDRTYIPDILVTYKDGSQKLIEVKPEYLVDDPQNQAKFSAAQTLYGQQFEIWTEEELI